MRPTPTVNSSATAADSAGSPPSAPRVGPPLRRYILLLLLAYPAWIGMEITHECGHVLNAWINGAAVRHVSLPFLGFSRTDVVHNSHPAFVAWGGPAWGSVLPLLAIAVIPRRVLHLRGVVCVFAGFCLIANGSYLGLGWIDGAGDAGDLLRHGAAKWELIAFGAIAMVTGLYIWHLTGRVLRASDDAG